MLPESQQDQLRRELIMLHSVLEGLDEVDSETIDSLRLVAADINSVLDQESPDHNWPQLGQRWRDAILDFESQHPRLTQVLDQITNVLANAGI